VVQGKLDFLQGPKSAGDNASHNLFLRKVKLTLSDTVEFSIVQNQLETEQLGTFSQLLNIAIKNSMMAKMMSFGRSPRMFFFKPDMQGTRMVWGEGRQRVPPNLGELFIGLIQAAHVTGNSNVFLIADFAHGWIRPEKTKTHPPGPIMILQPDRHGGGTLAGVYLRNLQERVPVDKQKQIVEALQKISFHIKYVCGPKW